jgi:hypothetical protein
VVGGGGVCRGGNGRAAALVVACDVDVSSRFGAVRSRAAGHTHTSVDEAPRARAPAGRCRVGPLVGASGTGAFRWLGLRARATAHAACPSRFPFRPVVLPWTGGVAWRVPRPLVNGERWWCWRSERSSCAVDLGLGSQSSSTVHVSLCNSTSK